MKTLYFIIFIFSNLSLLNCRHSADEWRSRAIYQIITDRWARNDQDQSVCDYSKYCGGNWKSIVNHLDYIKNMGFNAIWISPIPENTENDYHGYAFTNLYEVNSHFGTEDDLINLVEECHKRDIWVMVDVVANHCGCVNEDFSRVTPFNKAEYFHDKCDIVNWDNQDEVENCRLSNLPDLKQENEWVAETLCNWVKDIVDKYDFDGIRVDTVPEVPKWFWDKFGKASGVFQMGEVFNSNPSYVGGYQGHLDAVLNYPLYFSLRSGFCEDKLSDIEYYVQNSRKYFKSPELLGVFLENHDNARFLHDCNDKKKFKNAIVFTMTYEGIPILYYGGEQYYSGGNDPGNREPFWGNYNEKSDMYIILKKINKLRKDTKFYLEDTIQRYADPWFYAYTRGNVLVALVPGSGCQRTITFHSFKDGDILCNILADNDCVSVSKGKIEITMGFDPKVYVKQ